MVTGLGPTVARPSFQVPHNSSSCHFRTVINIPALPNVRTVSSLLWQRNLAMCTNIPNLMPTARAGILFYLLNYDSNTNNCLGFCFLVELHQQLSETLEWTWWSPQVVPHKLDTSNLSWVLMGRAEACLIQPLWFFGPG